MNGIRNIIFDLGGVILDLSVGDTLKAFASLSRLPVDAVREGFVSSGIFEDFEKGILDDAKFRDSVRDLYQVTASDGEIDACWNAMLLGFPVEKLRLLTHLKTEFQVFLLSNTNGIHLRHINEVLLSEATGESDLDVYFHRAYYSHRMLSRKPELQIFETVIRENALVPSESLFVDDNIENVRGAERAGLNGVWASSNNFILGYFNGERK